MAYLADYAITYLNGAITNTAMNMPVHQANDVLVVFVTMDTGSATITAGTGWAATANNTTQASITATWTWKVATTSAETISITTSDAYCCGIYAIRDVNTAAPINASLLNSAAAPTNPTKAISDAVTPTANDCFVLYLLGSDLQATAAHSEPGVHHINSFDNQAITATTSAAQHAAWYFHKPANIATPAPQWTQSVMAAYVKLTVAISNAINGIIPAYIDDTTAPATTITPGHHVATLNNIAYTTTLTSTAAINSKTVTAPAAAAAQGDLGIVPFSAGVSPPAVLVAKTALQAYQLTLTGNRNWSTGLIIGSHIGATPKMGTFGIGSVTDGGVVVRIGSSATAWAAYQVAAGDAVPTTEVRTVWAIQPGFTGTTYGTPGTAVTTTAVSHVQFLMNSPLFASQAIMSEFYQVQTIVAAGGSPTAPVSNDGLASIGRSFRLPVIQKSGAAGLISYVPIRIGGGDPINFQINFGTLQFPKRYSPTTKEISFHANNNVVGIEYYGKSGDVIKHTNSTITSPNKYFWTFNALTGNTSIVTYDFTGLSVIGAGIVGLSSVVPLNQVLFVQCDEIDISSANTLTSCVFSQSTANTTTEGAIKIASTTQAGLQTIVNRLVNCEFTNNTSNAAIDIVYTGTAGPITLSMTSGTFSGNSKDIRWDAPASSNLTINLSGTANPSTSFATNSNIVTLASTKTFTVTNIQANTELVLYKKSDNSFLASVEDIGNTTPGEVNLTIATDTENTGKYKATYSYNYAVLGVDTPVFVVAHSLGYQWLRQTATLKNTDSEFKISQIVDRQYQNP